MENDEESGEPLSGSTRGTDEKSTGGARREIAIELALGLAWIFGSVVALLLNFDIDGTKGPDKYTFAVMLLFPGFSTGAWLARRSAVGTSRWVLVGFSFLCLATWCVAAMSFLVF